MTAPRSGRFGGGARGRQANGRGGGAGLLEHLQFCEGLEIRSVRIFEFFAATSRFSAEIRYCFSRLEKVLGDLPAPGERVVFPPKKPRRGETFPPPPNAYSFRF